MLFRLTWAREMCPMQCTRPVVIPSWARRVSPTWQCSSDSSLTTISPSLLKEVGYTTFFRASDVLHHFLLVLSRNVPFSKGFFLLKRTPSSHRSSLPHWEIGHTMRSIISDITQSWSAVSTMFWKRTKKPLPTFRDAWTFRSTRRTLNSNALDPIFVFHLPGEGFSGQGNVILNANVDSGRTSSVLGKVSRENRSTG